MCKLIRINSRIRDFNVDNTGDNMNHLDNNIISVESNAKKASDMNQNSDDSPQDIYFKRYFLFLL